MTDFKLTEQQKKYLLYLEDFNENNTISDFSKYFNCSRTNSKKILDRMLKLGVFYKEDNRYLLTTFGKKLSQSIYEDRNNINKCISSMFFLNKEETNHYSNSLMGTESDFVNFLVKKSRKFKKSPNKKTVISYNEIKDILGVGRFPVSFVIYKNESTDKNSSIGFSMANKAFEDRCYIEIGDESYISMSSKTLKKNHKGYFKKGVIQELFYKKNGTEYEVSSVDSVIKIPLDVFSFWQAFGNGIFCSNIWIKNKVSIGFINHSKKSNYLIILNLTEI